MPDRKPSSQIVRSFRPSEKANLSSSISTDCPSSDTLYRTPRRACKDLALARLLAPTDLDFSLSASGSSCAKAEDLSFSNHSSDSSSLSLESPTKRLRSLSISSNKNRFRRSASDWNIRGPTGASCRVSTKPSSRRPTDRLTQKHTKTTHCSNVKPCPESETPTSRRKRALTSVTRSACRPTKPTRCFIPRRTFSVEPTKRRRRPTFRSFASTSECLPGREYEFDTIETFISGKLAEDSGGCMYISGLPGTGKTASVNAVLTRLAGEQLQQQKPPFQKVTINGMQVDDPKQVYVQIYQQITGQVLSSKQAAQQLEVEFCAPPISSASSRKGTHSRACPVVMVIDELDLLCTRRQDVLYNLFDWPTRPRGRRSLIVIAIANTMDLPERLLHPRVASRLGLTRLTFAPYSHEQLAHIVRSHLSGGLADSFQDKALELAARKVAAVSGDVRRALDICRRAVEMASLAKSAKPEIGISHINSAIKEMFTTPKTIAIRACSVYEKLFLQALVAEFQARSTEEARLDRCIRQMCALCRLDGMACPTTSEVFDICSSLGAHKLLLTEPSRRDTSMLVRLNCSKSDLIFALKQRAGA